MGEKSCVHGGCWHLKGFVSNGLPDDGHDGSQRSWAADAERRCPVWSPWSHSWRSPGPHADGLQRQPHGGRGRDDGGRQRRHDDGGYGYGDGHGHGDGRDGRAVRLIAAFRLIPFWLRHLNRRAANPQSPADHQNH